jgi:hypothetical protein
MHNRQKLIILLFTIPFSLFLMSWGYNGHNKINGNAHLSFTPEMEQFQAWAITLAEHASDADYRKDIDPNEGPRHYLDIDNYPGFLTSGRIPQTYDSVIALYGQAFVIDQGVLPWATKIAYDSLVNSFARFDWTKAVLFASDLGHYVADGHQPLHITRNYDGQYTGNNDIHSHYETGMINAYKDEIIYTGDDIAFITDVDAYIFNYIYSNYIYVDPIMVADDYAQSVAGNNTSSAYKAALWDKTKGFTIPLFKGASHALAELIYSAWVQAGKPDMNSGPGIIEWNTEGTLLQIQIIPNPVKESGTIRFNLPDESDVCMQVLDTSGAVMENLINKKLPEGSHEFSFDLAHLPEGIYFISLETGKYKGIGKLVKTGSH